MRQWRVVLGLVRGCAGDHPGTRGLVGLGRWARLDASGRGKLDAVERRAARSQAAGGAGLTSVEFQARRHELEQGGPVGEEEVAR